MSFCEWQVYGKETAQGEYSSISRELERRLQKTLIPVLQKPPQTSRRAFQGRELVHTHVEWARSILPQAAS